MKRKKIRTHYLLMIIFCSILLTVGAVLLFFSYYAVYKVYDIKMAINVSDHPSFNVDTDFINFGKGTSSGSNTRTIVLSHTYSKPLLISFQKSGNISAFVNLPEEFYLEPSLSKEVNLNAIVPPETPQGYYDGELRVYFRRI